MCDRDDEEDKPLYGTAARARWNEDAAEAASRERHQKIADDEYHRRIEEDDGDDDE